MLVQLMQLNLRSCLYAMRCTIWYYLRNLKNVKNTHGGVLLSVKLKPATLLKVTILHWCCLCFSNRTNGTESRKASHMILRNHSFSYRTKKGTQEKKMKSFAKRIKNLLHVVLKGFRLQLDRKQCDKSVTNLQVFLVGNIT